MLSWHRNPHLTQLFHGPFPGLSLLTDCSKMASTIDPRWYEPDLKVVGLLEHHGYFPATNPAVSLPQDGLARSMGYAGSGIVEDAPSTMRPLAPTMFRMERPITLAPRPLSPPPVTLPGLKSYSPFTALTVPSWVKKWLLVLDFQHRSTCLFSIILPTSYTGQLRPQTIALKLNAKTVTTTNSPARTTTVQGSQSGGSGPAARGCPQLWGA